MHELLTLKTLEQIIGPIKPGTVQAANAHSFKVAVNKFGSDLGLNHLHRLSYLLGQVMLECGAFRFDRELWGPTKAQARYDLRADLGNTPERDGDGFKYRGRTGIQITGKANYRDFTKWARRLDPNAPDFVADPDAANTDPWEGLGPLWYWSTRGLNALADSGDVRAVTRCINGGYNHLSERQRYTDRAQLVLLGHGPTDVQGFQRKAGLVADGQIGPKTRAALHKALLAVPPIVTPKPAPVSALPDWLRRFLSWVGL